jgi:succinate dehydrogenase/fumarate reductase flavoprotein subunit
MVMSDLIERLRSRRRYATVEELHEAADEIERLRKQVRRWQDELEAEIERLKADRDHHWKISMDLSDKNAKLQAVVDAARL